jgi:hypothetical protein
MRSLVWMTAAGLGLGLLAATGGATDLKGADPRTGQSAPPVPAPKPKEDCGCGSYGTSVEFLSSPSEAARQAKKEQKLVFVLHVSGHFEDPKFT